MFKLIRSLLKAIGWLQICLSPTLSGIIIAGVVYGLTKNTLGFIIAVIIALSGFITGVVWATKIWKKQGTIEFMSKVNNTPELDNLEKP